MYGSIIGGAHDSGMYGSMIGGTDDSGMYGSIIGGTDVTIAVCTAVSLVVQMIAVCYRYHDICTTNNTVVHTAIMTSVPPIILSYIPLSSHLYHQ